MAERKMSKSAARSYWDSAVKSSRGSMKRDPSKPPMGQKRKSASQVAKERKQRVIAKKAGPTKRRVAGEPPNRSMASKARSVRAGRVRDRKVGQMNSNIKKMQTKRPR